MLARKLLLANLRFSSHSSKLIRPCSLAAVSFNNNYQNYRFSPALSIYKNSNVAPLIHFQHRTFFSNRKDFTPKDDPEDESKLSLFQKFKLMYKRYWYVLVPVHCATSVVWYGSFFLAAKSGVDIVPVLQSIGVTSEYILSHLGDSDAGYYAIAYAMYKIATPARYTVTLGCTTVSINYLKNRGYIKPVPTKQQLEKMYEDKKDEMMDKYEDKRDKMKGRIEGKRREMRGKFEGKRREMNKMLDKNKKIVTHSLKRNRRRFSKKFNDKKEEFREKFD